MPQQRKRPDLNESQNRYMIVFENHVDTKDRYIFDHYLRKDVETLRERVKDKTATKEDLSLKWLLLKYRFPREMRDFLINFVYGDSNIDVSLLQPNIYFVDNAEGIVIDDQGTSRSKWEKLQSRDELIKLYGDHGEKKLVFTGAVTLEELRSFVSRHYTEMNQQLESATPKPNYFSKRRVEVYPAARYKHRVAELSEMGLDAIEIDMELGGKKLLSYKKVNEIKAELQALRDDEYTI